MILPLHGERAGVREDVITNLCEPFPTMPLLTELGFIFIVPLYKYAAPLGLGILVGGLYKYVARTALVESARGLAQSRRFAPFGCCQPVRLGTK